MAEFDQGVATSIFTIRALRCRLLLLAHQGIANQSIAQQLSLSRPTILAFRTAFGKDGISAITDVRKRKGQARVLTPEVEQKILETTLKTRPGEGSTHWSVRMLAKQLGISRTIIHGVWRRHEVQPHRPGLPERQTHDYQRHGATTLFAAFNILNGKVMGTCLHRHRSREFVRFLNHLEKQLPADQEVHLIMDHYCTHKSAEV